MVDLRGKIFADPPLQISNHHLKKRGTPIMADKPKDLTIKGRVSYPTFTYAEAVARNAKSKYPKADVNTIRPSVSFSMFTYPL